MRPKRILQKHTSDCVTPKTHPISQAASKMRLFSILPKRGNERGSVSKCSGLPCELPVPDEEDEEGGEPAHH